MPPGQWLKRIAAHYAVVHTCGKEPAAIMAIDLTDWARTIEKIAEGLHDGTLSATDLNEGFIRDTYGELAAGAREGYGKGWSKPAPDTGTIPDDVRAMQQNIWRFSVSKDFAVQVALSEALVQNGKVTPYQDFRAYALKLNKEYNQTHLRTEYLTARQGANMAAQWQTYQDGKEQFPNLKYRTQEDDRVREEHQALAGKVAAVDDPFWNTFYPPNGWRCRCYVVQTAEAVSSALPAVKDVPGMKEQFVGNVGKSGQLFNEGMAKGAKEHPYFALAKDKGGPELQKQMELSKLYAPANEIHRAENGATVSQNIWADPKGLTENRDNAVLIADTLGMNVQLAAHTDGHVLQKQKNPEYLIDGKVADLKAPEKESITKRLSSASKQKCEVVVFNLDNSPLTVEECLRQAQNKMDANSNYPGIKEYIIIKDGKASHHFRKPPKNKKADR